MSVWNMSPRVSRASGAIERAGYCKSWLRNNQQAAPESRAITSFNT